MPVTSRPLLGIIEIGICCLQQGVGLFQLFYLQSDSKPAISLKLSIRSSFQDFWAPCNVRNHNSASFTWCKTCKASQVFIAWFALLFASIHSSCLQRDVSAAVAACTFHTKAAWFAPGLRIHDLISRAHVPNAVNLAMLTSRLHFAQLYLFFYLLIYITFQKRISI